MTFSGTKFFFVTIILFTGYILSGCNNNETQTDATKQNNEQLTEISNHSIHNKNPDYIDTQNPLNSQTPSSETKIPNNELLTKTPPPNFKTSEVPQVPPTSAFKDTPWGQIKKTSVFWHDDIDISYEIPVFNGTSPAIIKINEFLQKRSDLFFSPDNLANCWEYEHNRHANPPNDNDHYKNVYTTTVNDINEKYISVSISYEYYMGGVLDYGTHSYVFDAQTGFPVSLPQISGKSIEELRNTVVSAIREQVNEEKLNHIEWKNIHQADDFDYYIKDNTIHVTFVKYEIANGGYGAFDIILPLSPSGMYSMSFKCTKWNSPLFINGEKLKFQDTKTTCEGKQFKFNSLCTVKLLKADDNYCESEVKCQIVSDENQNNIELMPRQLPTNMQPTLYEEFRNAQLTGNWASGHWYVDINGVYHDPQFLDNCKRDKCKETETTKCIPGTLAYEFGFGEPLYSSLAKDKIVILKNNKDEKYCDINEDCDSEDICCQELHICSPEACNGCPWIRMTSHKRNGSELCREDISKNCDTETKTRVCFDENKGPFSMHVYSRMAECIEESWIKWIE